MSRMKRSTELLVIALSFQNSGYREGSGGRCDRQNANVVNVSIKMFATVRTYLILFWTIIRLSTQCSVQFLLISSGVKTNLSV